MSSAMSIKQRNKPGDNFQSPPIIGVVGVVSVSVHKLNPYDYNNDYMRTPMETRTVAQMLRQWAVEA